MSDTTATTAALASLSTNELVARITALESLVASQTAQLAAATAAAAAARRRSSSRSATPPPAPKPKSAPRAFDATRHATRFIALKFAYLGGEYNGFEHANGTVPPRPTVEEVLWKALRKARLISPVLAEGVDRSMDVVWGAEERRRRYLDDSSGGGERRLEVEWEGCQYSKAGRTDRGVSAFGQVVGVRVRSNRPLERTGDQNGGVEDVPAAAAAVVVSQESETVQDDGLPRMLDEEADKEDTQKTFDPVADEIPYLSILNSILPPTIRMLAWCPSPPEDFDARFSCRERRYKYFFTNPAFCPTPGPLGMQHADGSPSDVREGWLDVDRMRTAARKLVGLNDFRNLCKIDKSKQMESCERRITHADVVEWNGSGNGFASEPALNDGLEAQSESGAGVGSTGPKVYAFEVHGSAFLWHQVRCMVAVLFLVGQRLEEPEIIDQLFDIEKNPGRPVYEMADDAPLVLWDCIFPGQEEQKRNDHQAGEVDSKQWQDGLHWVYAGDKATLPSLQTRNDGKFGGGAVMGELWSQWREAKMQEVLTGSLLDLALSQGDGTPLRRGGIREEGAFSRSQKVFDGSSKPKMAGVYIPVMNKVRMETLERQNEKYRTGKGARINLRRAGQATDEAGGGGGGGGGDD